MELTDRASKLDKRVRAITRAEDWTWWDLGEICATVRDEKLWKLISHDGKMFRTFGEWMDDALNVCRKTAFEAMRVCDALRFLDRETKHKMSRQNAKALAGMVESKRQSQQWLEKALTMRAKDFKQLVEADKVGAEKSEPRIRKHLSFEESQWKTVSDGFDYLRQIEGVQSLEQAIEYAMAELLSGLPEGGGVWQPETELVQ